jgi:transcription antitermination factor NusG
MHYIETKRGEAFQNEGCFSENDWLVLWTRSNCEQLVRQQITSKGFETFLPMMKTWRTRAGVRHQIDVPMFPSYLFVRGLRDKPSHIEVRKTRGLVQVLGGSWDHPAVVPEQEIGAIQKLTRAALETFATPFLHQGQRVRVVYGPLKGIEGTLIRSNTRTGLLVLSIELLQRSVAAEVHCSLLKPV